MVWWSSRRRSTPAAAAKPAALNSPQSAAEARAAAEQILGMDIRGHTVHKVLVAPGVSIAVSSISAWCWTGRSGNWS